MIPGLLLIISIRSRHLRIQYFLQSLVRLGIWHELEFRPLSIWFVTIDGVVKTLHMLRCCKFSIITTTLVLSHSRLCLIFSGQYLILDFPRQAMDIDRGVIATTQ